MAPFDRDDVPAVRVGEQNAVDQSAHCRPSCRLDGFVVEAVDSVDDVLQAVLGREVAGVEADQLRVGEVAQVGLAAGRGEEDVTPAPEDQRLALVAAQPSLPGGVLGRVRAVVVEEIELHLRASERARKCRSRFQLSGLIFAGSRWPVR